MKYLILLLLVFYSVPALSCDKVTPVINGELIKCDGMFVPIEKMKEITILKLSYEELLKQSELQLQKEVIIKEQLKLTEEMMEKERKRTNIWRKKTIEMTEKYIEVEDNRGKRDWVFLSSGIILTVLAGFAVGAASK